MLTICICKEVLCIAGNSGGLLQVSFTLCALAEINLKRKGFCVAVIKVDFLRRLKR